MFGCSVGNSKKEFSKSFYGQNQSRNASIRVTRTSKQLLETALGREYDSQSSHSEVMGELKSIDPKYSTVTPVSKNYFNL